MTTEQTTPSGVRPTATSAKGSWKAAVWIAVAVFLLVLIAVNARVGAVSPRIRNPEVTGAPRPVEPLFGYQHWLVRPDDLSRVNRAFFQVNGVISVGLFLIVLLQVLVK